MSVYSSINASTSLRTSIHSTDSAVATICAVRGMHVARILEVVREPLAQARRLADIDHPAARVLELVRAGCVRDRAGWWALDHLLMTIAISRLGLSAR